MDTSDLEALAVRGAMEALGQSMQHWLGESQRIVPLEEGTLAGTGEVVYVVNGAEFTGGSALSEATAAAVRLAKAGALAEVHGRLQYGTPYAAAQHEGHATMHRGGASWEWTAQHYTAPGRGPKYVSRPLNANVARYREAIGLGWKGGPLAA